MTITTLAERPRLAGPVWEMPYGWPEFMDHDPVAWSLFGPVTAARPDLCVVATDGSGEVVGYGHTVAFARSVPGRRRLPDTGWDQVMLWASSDLRKGVEPDVVSAIGISVHVDHRGRGLSSLLLAALRDNARALGFSTMLAPVRPTAKHEEPGTPTASYVSRVRGDGLPVDPWLRVHVRAGGRLAGVAPASMVVPGSLAQWRAWTGLPFDTAGPVEVPFALVPVHCDPSHDHAVYVEPNVWVVHDLRP